MWESTFWFLLSMLCVEILFVKDLKKKAAFTLRLVLVLLALSAFLYLAYVQNMFVAFLVDENAGIRFVLFSVLAIVFFHETTLPNVFFIGLTGLTAASLSDKLYQICVQTANVSASWGKIAIHLASIAVVFFLFWIAFRFDIIQKSKDPQRASFAIMIAVTLILTFVFQTLITMNNQELPFLCMEALLLFLAFLMLFISVNQKRLRTENAVMQELLENQKQQYEISKEYANLINIKYHDIKHLLLAMSSDGQNMAAEQLEEIQNSIKIYDTAIHTGNKALDIVLTEKNMLCSNKNIQITSIADGKLLNFMKSSDIYALFGNLLDNAVEAVEKLDEKERRFISLSLRQDTGVIRVLVENYYSGELKTSDENMFLTAKADTLYHGFGMKSIRLIAEKYDGVVHFSGKNHIFSANLVFPVPM